MNTKRIKFADIKDATPKLKEAMEAVAKENNLEPASLELWRKGYEVYKQPDFIDDEKAVITYITTARMDRDDEIVKPEGIKLSDYEKHRVVLFAHKYNELPIGKNMWIKADANGKGLVAKTLYTSKEANPLGSQIFTYRKEGFPMGTSIGFVPTKMITKTDISRNIEFKSELENAMTKGWITPDQAPKVKSIIQECILLEYSDVPVPCNPDALQLACSKGLISKEEYESELKLLNIEGKEDKEISFEVVPKETESKKDVSVVPPVEITGIQGDLNKETMEKIFDSAGNPSTNDIHRALSREMEGLKEKIRSEHDSSLYKDEYSDHCYVVDLYPISYPNGSCIIEYCCIGLGDKFYKCNYKFDATTQKASLSEPKEMKVGYSSKSVKVISEDKLSFIYKNVAAKIKQGKATTSDLLTLPEATITINKDWKNPLDDTYTVFVSSEKAGYFAKFSESYIQLAKAYGERQEKIKQEFSKFVSIQGRDRKGWDEVFNIFTNFANTSFLGKDQILEFCKSNELLHKELSVKPEVEAQVEDDEVVLKGIEETENEISIRIKDPSLFQDATFRRKKIKTSSPIIIGLFAKLKGESSMSIQALRFPKSEGWTKESAKKWYKEHKNGFKSFVNELASTVSEEEIVDFMLVLLKESKKINTEVMQESLGKIMGKVQI